MKFKAFKCWLVAMILIMSCGKEPGVQTEPFIYLHVAAQRVALATKPYTKPVRLLDSLQIMSNIQYLSSDTCAGRSPGTPGHARALERIATHFRKTGLDSFGNRLVQTFNGSYSIEGKNIVGWLKGTTNPEKYIVITAHYDHFGTINGATYYGADDNASGVACIMALASYFSKHPHRYSLVFAVLDKEETGLEGAHNLVREFESTNKLPAIKMNLNLDMVARSDSNEIFACGIKRYPALRYLVDSVQSKTNVKLLMGHDGGNSGDDWTKSSDHSPFNDKEIPFLYIGVEDHANYHQTTDTYSRINPHRYLENCNMIASILLAVR